MFPSMTCTCGAITASLGAIDARPGSSKGPTGSDAVFFLPKSGIGLELDFAFFKIRLLASFARSSADF